MRADLRTGHPGVNIGSFASPRVRLSLLRSAHWQTEPDFVGGAVRFFRRQMRALFSMLFGAGVFC
jgi:hypothetical protein